ncbi:MAG: SPOR domain-containing protein [Hyphomicrobiales bacterium]
MMVSKVIIASLVACAVALSSQSATGENASNSADKVPVSVTAAKPAHDWRKAIRSGHYQDAANALSAIISDKKTSTDERAVAYLNRALAHQYLRQFKLAVADYGKALELDALSLRVRAIALYNRGLANRNLGRPALAIEDFTSALHLDTKFSHAFYSRANVMRAIGRRQFAIADYERSLKFGYPQAHLPHYGIAVTYDELKQPAKARASLKTTLKLKPGFKPALIRYAELAGEPYHSPAPSLQVAGMGALPKKSASKIETVPHVAPGQKDLPAAVPPPKAYLTAQKGGGAPAVDTITTASLGKTGGAGLKLSSSGKHSIRYPGFTGKTAPVPTKVARAGTKKQTAQLPQIVPAAGTTGAAAKVAEKKQKKVRVAALTPTVPQAVAEKPAQPKVTGWLVQVNSQRSEKAAKATWGKLKRRHVRAFGDSEAVFQRADLGKKGIYWRVRLAGFAKKSEAYKKCKTLKRNGVSCFVVRAN